MPRFDIVCNYTEVSWGDMSFYVEADSLEEAIELWKKDPWSFDFDHIDVWDSETTEISIDEESTRNRNA